MPLVSLLMGVLVLGNVSSAAALLAWGDQSGLDPDALAQNEWQATALGGHHTLALTSAGAVRGWGENYYGQCNAPPEKGFTAIAAGLYHSLALRRDGSIVVWGDNTRRQCRTPAAGGFVAVGSGDWHCLAIRSDGSLAAWGWNEYGQCDVPGGKNYTAVCGGHVHSLALTTDGAVVAWGSNAAGQCDAPDGNEFVAVAAGAFHSLALRSNGTVVAWGCNDDGQCEVPAGGRFVGIAAGAFHSLALKRDGSVVAWGHDDYGQCDTPADVRLVSVAAGGYRSFGIRAMVSETAPWEQLDYDTAPALAVLERLASRVADEWDRAVRAAVVLSGTKPREGAVTIDEAAVAVNAVDDKAPFEAPVRVATDVPEEPTVARTRALVTREDEVADGAVETTGALVAEEPGEATPAAEIAFSVVPADESPSFEALVSVAAQFVDEVTTTMSQVVTARADARGPDRKVVPIAERGGADPYHTPAPAAVPITAQATAPVLGKGNAADQELQTSATGALAEPVKGTMSPDTTGVRYADVDPDISRATPRPKATTKPKATTVIARGDISKLTTRAKQEPRLSKKINTQPVPKKTITLAHSGQGESTGAGGATAVVSDTDEWTQDIMLVLSIMKGPLLIAAGVALSLALGGASFFLSRRKLRVWRAERRRRQQIQDDLFWRFLLRADRPRP